ncbi:CRISPR-associated endonuclease Cas2 [Candidatus Kaiserbacteria bacterium RIFCSPLOWO2_02_FULL_54_13]|uniref:CRISPR-associated endonuclease Cas2 n=1 Tax=Candidatus Kaiserbacteria bacterium RIFCSPHIGHO2_02_FULL_54_22 TaxID=1798495 RepID=A0A1F6DJX9_9BACT|nr:MAG: CRISPR-associated endonuclease Cas2 [Candidatus Kaiserbacteria bacterium RIFCSPHIGHO2_02_FULL_54_22]OGG68351.1 MAG: CRISPR-associated endonuclease Cas2 [Candidatus Kaiserbacteria bacterium RIFCSPHIGHO2_12_FULL_54_16]OGG82572.1 MAG: CRISPR-associated endonuclease Cas2 [Candidatus Kaiserbacteria bacterium RIFCSPLOWO2_02_FULL_54_13]
MRIEEKVRQRAKRQKIQKAVLASVYLTAGLGLILMAPNAARLLKYVGKYIGPKPRLNRRINQAVNRLRERGLIERVETNRGIALRLTAKGAKLAASLEDEEKHFKIQKPKRWDCKWRIVIFDIWERRRSVRDRLRTLLQRNGFVKIQNSVWVYPYDCEELFVFLRTNLRLGKGILYIVAEEVENDGTLRKHFGLPSV